MASVNRRQFVSRSAGAAALGLTYGGSAAGLAMAQGRSLGTFRVFNAVQADTYAAWCDELVTGAGKAGVARFVDKYLAEPHASSLLLQRYLQNPPYAAFYLGGIAGVEKESAAQFSMPFLALDTGQRKSIVRSAVTSSITAWSAPDPNLFYFISRSDAVDVVYGTVAGFRDLDIPYLAHIVPDEPW